MFSGWLWSGWLWSGWLWSGWLLEQAADTRLTGRMLSRVPRRQSVLDRGLALTVLNSLRPDQPCVPSVCLCLSVSPSVSVCLSLLCLSVSVCLSLPLSLSVCLSVSLSRARARAHTPMYVCNDCVCVCLCVSVCVSSSQHRWMFEHGCQDTCCFGCHIWLCMCFTFGYLYMLNATVDD